MEERVLVKQALGSKLLVSALRRGAGGFAWDGGGGRPTWNSLRVGSSHVLASRRDFGTGRGYNRGYRGALFARADFQRASQRCVLVHDPDRKSTRLNSS